MMKNLMLYIYIVYQFLVALPILLVITLVSAVLTLLFAPWKNSVIPHACQVLWARSVYRLLWISIKVEGEEHLETGQSYVFVCNHQSYLDVFAIYGWLPRTFKWMMKKELRKLPIVGLACCAAGHVFVDRSNPKAAMESVKRMEGELRRGVSTVIFPEGTRTHTGEVGVFKRGAFMIAEHLHLPIVPLSITGCYEAMPRGQHYVGLGGSVCLRIGEPIDMESFATSNEAIQTIRERVVEGMGS